MSSKSQKKWSIWRDPNVWIGIGLAAIVIPMLIWAIVHHVRRGDIDEGLMHVSIDGEEVELRPCPRFPAPWDVVADKSVDRDILLRSVKTWNDAVGEKLLRARVDQGFFDNPLFLIQPEYRFGTVAVTVATEPGGEGCGGITRHNYDKMLIPGEVYWADVTINPMYTHDEDSYEKAMVHELGHVLLLAHDDEHSSSIMRKRLNIRGKITDHDKELVRKTWTQPRPEKL